MEKTILALLPMIIVVILYILIFSRKEELLRVKRSWRKYDWITFFSGIFGGILFSSAMRASGLQFPVVPLLITTTVILVGAVGFALIRRMRTGRPVIQQMGDERTEMILAKSARNAFFATYLSLFIRLFVSDEGILDENWMLIVLGSGLAVLLISLPFYAYRKS